MNQNSTGTTGKSTVFFPGLGTTPATLPAIYDWLSSYARLVQSASAHAVVNQLTKLKSRLRYLTGKELSTNGLFGANQ